MNWHHIIVSKTVEHANSDTDKAVDKNVRIKFKYYTFLYICLKLKIRVK